MTSLRDALALGAIVLDGGLSTELERAGHDVSGALWSAALLRGAPDAIVAAHRAFFDAGARIATTASYQATFEGFAAAGLDPQDAAALMTESVTLARRALVESGLDGHAWVAASVGPYGAMLANGAEYTGAYGSLAGAGAGGVAQVAALRAFHRRRLEVLASAGADVLACETIPTEAEAEALIAEVAALGVPAWLCLTTVTGRDGVVRTRLGEDATRAFGLARGVDSIVAVGVNCTDPRGVRRAVELAAAASGKPVIVYPNSGETWDGPSRTWRGTADFAAQDVAGWLAAGARIVGGCCRVGPAQIAQIGQIAQMTRQLSSTEKAPFTTKAAKAPNASSTVPPTK